MTTVTGSMDFQNRVMKRFKQLQKWAKRSSVTCFRVYERDLPDFPVTVDWLDGKVVAWVAPRKRDDTPALSEAFQVAVGDALLAAFPVNEADIFLKHRGKQSGLSVQYQRVSEAGVQHIIEEGGLRFELNLSDYLDTGLFLDHRKTRALCQSLSKGKRVLNLFAYTGSFTCYARIGGALSTTTVDLSATYIDWAKRNMALNELTIRPSDRFIVDNCLSFVKLDAAKNRYDLIICDPPTFSNSKKMKFPFSINEDYPDLLQACSKLLAPAGKILFSTNSRSFQMDPSRLPQRLSCQEWHQKTVSEDFKGKPGHRLWLLEKDS